MNWDDWEALMYHTLYETLGIAPEEYPILLTERFLNPKANRVKMTQIMFELFNSPELYVADPTVLSLYSSGKKSGLIVDIGEGVSQIHPIYEGIQITPAMERVDMGGSKVSEYLQLLLKKSGRNFDTSAELKILENLKIETSFVSQNPHHEAECSMEYQLPDGEKIQLHNERFLCNEILFHPSILEIPEKGIHELISGSVKKCPLQVRRDMLSQILLFGGATMPVGFPSRLKDELVKLVPPSVEVGVFAEENRNIAAFMGGSIYASLPHSQWFSKAEYDESGFVVGRRRTFW